MADFTTWTALKTAMLNQLNNRDLMVGSYKLPDGREVKYRTADEFAKLYSLVSGQAESEGTSTGKSSRAVTMSPISDRW